MASFEGEAIFSSPGPNVDLSAFVPATEQAPQANGQGAATAAVPETRQEEDDVDLFGSDDEEEDEEATCAREQRLREYQQRKAGKVKPAAKTTVMLDVKPWGAYLLHPKI
jgi:elongation factor 1-beta